MGEDEGAAAARRQAARLQTMAGLARPVQHEINNLLTVIFANLEMLKRTAAEGGPQRQLDRVAEAARRFEASSRGFLSLARRRPRLHLVNSPHRPQQTAARRLAVRRQAHQLLPTRTLMLHTGTPHPPLLYSLFRSNQH